MIYTRVNKAGQPFSDIFVHRNKWDKRSTWKGGWRVHADIDTDMKLWHETAAFLPIASSGGAGGYLLPLLSSQSFILDSNSWLSPIILDHPQRPIVADVPLLLFPQTLWGNYYQQANIVPEGIIRGGRGWLCRAIIVPPTILLATNGHSQCFEN